MSTEPSPASPSRCGPRRPSAGLSLAAGGMFAALLAAAAAQAYFGGVAAGAIGVAVALLAPAFVLAFARRADGATSASEKALRRSEAELRAAVDGLLDAVVTMDEDGAIRSANPAASRMFGYAPGELAGRNLAELAPLEREGTNAGRATQAGFDREGRRKDGARFPVDVSLSEVRVDGRRTIVGRIHDLSERKAAEEALRHAQKMEAVGRLTGGVAHDFNNVLTVILAYSGLLCEALPDGDGKLRRMAEQIRSAARSAAELTRQLLAFSRRQSLEPAELDVNELLRSVERLLRPALGELIELELRLTDEPARVFVDPAQFQATLMNLAVNGREAMPEGGRLTIETALEAHGDGRFVALTVRDEGVGMSPEVRMRAFEPFFTTKPIGMGSGLGLSMAYGFVKQSGGDVRVDSAPGRGASVTLLLPARGPADSPLSEAAEAQAD